MTRIVNLKREPGAVANGAVRIDRRTVWGNPFVVGRDGTRAQVIARYRTDLWRRIRAGEIALEEVAALNGRDLACHCAPLVAPPFPFPVRPERMCGFTTRMNRKDRSHGI